jgi:hypothetical protein
MSRPPRHPAPVGVLNTLRRLPATTLVALLAPNLPAYSCDRVNILARGLVTAGDPPTEILTSMHGGAAPHRTGRGPPHLHVLRLNAQKRGDCPAHH